MSSTSSSSPKVTVASLKAELDALRAEFAAFKASVTAPAQTTETTKTTKKRGEKKVRDPDAPKKPLSGYMIFTLEKRPVVKAEHPEMTFGQIGAELGRLWKALSDEEKESYKNTLNTYMENKVPIADIIDAKIAQV